MSLDPRQHKITLAVFLWVIAVLAFVLTLEVTGPQLSWDSQDYAQLARQLARGEGHTTKILIPSLSVTTHDEEPWPSLFRPPFPVFLISLSFGLFGINDVTAVLWSGLFYTGTVVLIFLAFEPIQGPVVALFSALIFALSGCGLIYARSGLTEPSAMFFLLCGFMFVINKNMRLYPLWAGLSLGLCVLNRPVAYLWAVVIFGHSSFCSNSSRRHRLNEFGLGSLGFLVPLLFARFVLHWNGGGELLATNLARGIGDEALAVHSPASFVLHHFLKMLIKAGHEAARVGMYLFQFGNVTLFSALSMFALFLPDSPREQEPRNMTIALIFLTAIALAFLTEGDAFVGPLRYFDVFVPLLLPWGVAAFRTLWNQRNVGSRYAIVGLSGLYLLAAGAQAIRDPFARLHSSESAMFRELQQIVPATEVIAASGSVNVPSIAWYGDRRAAFIPSNIETYLDILRQKRIPVNWYLGKDSDQIPEGFLKFKQWPGGFALFRKSV